jgi:predicted DCC family thiol-disulfide oxidoreductase YuxK
MRIPSWKEYWFRPWPLINLAVTRIIIVGFQLHALIRFDQHKHFAEYARRPDDLYDALPVVNMLLLPMGWEQRPSESFCHGVYWVTLVSGWFALLGLLTNPALILLTSGSLLITGYNYSFRDYHHPEGVLMIALMALALSPAGRSLAIDDLWRRMRRNQRTMRFDPYRRLDDLSEFARWPLVLLRWAYALIYFSAFKSKIQGGLEWANGHTLRYYMYQDGLRWGEFGWASWSLWLAEYHWLNVTLSWATLLFEGLFFLVLIFPRLAWIFIPAGTGMHLGIWFAIRAGFFTFIACYTVFIPWAEAFRLASARIERRCGARPDVLYDGHCPLCIRSVTVLHYLDWMGRMSFTDLERRPPDAQPPLARDDLRRQMHLVRPDGQLRCGFFAVRHACRYMPLLWIVLPLLYVPGVPFIGQRLYAAVANGRRRLCADGACAVHDAPKK